MGGLAGWWGGGSCSTSCNSLVFVKNAEEASGVGEDLRMGVEDGG